MSFLGRVMARAVIATLVSGTMCMVAKDSLAPSLLLIVAVLAGASSYVVATVCAVLGLIGLLFSWRGDRAEALLSILVLLGNSIGITWALAVVVSVAILIVDSLHPPAPSPSTTEAAAG
jgi:hypothetical protein